MLEDTTKGEANTNDPKGGEANTNDPQTGDAAETEPKEGEGAQSNDPKGGSTVNRSKYDANSRCPLALGQRLLQVLVRS